MKVIDWREFLEDGLNLGGKLSSMTVGVFDGVHRGHQALLKKILSQTDYTPVVVTFRENHKTMSNGQFSINSGQSDIYSFQRRLEIFGKMGIQITIVVDFTEEFRRMRGIEFLEILLKRGSVGFFAAGSNFRCGCGLDANAAVIREFFTSRGVPMEIIPEVLEGSLPVSSSRIREAAAAGDTALAAAMLGAPSGEAGYDPEQGPV